MSVERNKDGSVTIKNNNESTSIGKIVKVSDDKLEGKFQQWVEDCAKLVNACAHTFKETEQYFLQHCEALPLTPNDRRMKFFQLNVIMNHCKDKLEHQPSEFSFDMTDEEIEIWHKEENEMREEAMNSSPEHFGLNMRGYYLPHTKRNEVYFEQAYLSARKLMKHTDSNLKQVEVQDICFFFEETTEHCQSNGGENSLINQLIVFRGVTEDDIEKRNPRFQGYISTLREMGHLPDFRKE
ncbi:MAG TPA: hypothetical protein VIK78_15365 [Ruminiclostridium sp.]